MFNIFKSNYKKIPAYKLPIDVIKEKAKILFIDDEDVDLIPLLQNEKWHVEHWKDVQSLQVLESGKYDLIFLDIGGVGKLYSPDEEGFGILKRLKKVNPSVMIVSYSGQSFDASKSDFWSLSDGNLSKSSGAIKAMELMEDLLKEKFTSQALWADLKSILASNNVPDQEVDRIESLIVSGKKKDVEHSIASLLKKQISSESTTQALLGLASKIIVILKYMNGAS